jgi:hypothetical protein
MPRVCAVSNIIASIDKRLSSARRLSVPVEQRAKIDSEAQEYRQSAEGFE